MQNNNPISMPPAGIAQGHKDLEIRVDTSRLPEPKNIDGVEGEKCNTCGGYGFTVGLNGGHIDCKDCEKTGVKLPTVRDLQVQVSKISRDLNDLKNIILQKAQEDKLNV